ncbi:MAG TPA: hypothetical protein VKA27_05270, partial [Sunxiuqinia sp.]|nr:hypothetical protein [Sunxiuqinia sp.]
MNVLPLIILFPLISGFLFASNFEPLRYKIDRAENNRLYFLSAFYGFILFAFSSLLFLLLLFEKGVFNDFLKSINYKFGIQLSNIEEYIVVILLITMVLGPLLGKVLDLVIPERLRLKFYKRAIKDNDFDKLFL